MSQVTDRKRRREGGFTLTEIMVSVFIIGLLSTVVVLQVAPMISQSRDTKAKADIQVLQGALDQYSLDMFDYPTQQQGLAALATAPDALPDTARYRTGGYVQKVPLDPWGRAYVYERPGRRSGQAYDLYSLGADGEEGGDDLNADIGNWE